MQLTKEECSFIFSDSATIIDELIKLKWNNKSLEPNIFIYLYF